ncbi:hypothetical protein ACFV30_33730 [Streptomyces sp. NPDC059752]|uniref:hypothetical protein n=1 Tax=unclassified Streptomyces TaxID=2593676 RepID=UPI0036494A40
MSARPFPNGGVTSVVDWIGRDISMSNDIPVAGLQLLRHGSTAVRPPFHFPDDLITLQRAWQQTYTELAQAPAGVGTTALRRRLIALSGTLCTHPHWETPTAWRAVGVELRGATRTPTPAPTDGEAAA